ncbi:putative integral membrane protein [Streptomyces scabiei 87.22]|uniref:Putative integral membrane protein n=2 Tax=Streptomyces scabiei TaxID=1930 RepID=C9Z6E9_STRSW|nr:acyltransferase [Streptomyces scabiei]MDX2653372.1 acyltransferase [Streptomyces scabiei]MDX2724065.1 acyltransferase [Streptomyces scabiei]MDX2866303.1 acyltransferase [Streptomyces scabiei]MDX2883865.1 acyltransferase [Streptomyces scabiei]MDX2892126.1 acyltransferase [Streptomyces scabiei]
MAFADLSAPTVLSAAAARIEARTPAHRDRALDGLRALALLAVPVGHWMLGGLSLGPEGALHNASPLTAFGYLAPVSWVLQMLGIFFLVGGCASTLSLRRSAARGVPTGAWLRGRLARLGRPVLGVAAVWAVLLPVLYAAGVPAATLRTGAVLVVQPLWFVGIYVLVTALTPWCVRAARSWGAWAAVPLLGSVAVVDLLRYGPWADAMPSWLGLLNLGPGWLFAYQLGVCWGEGRLGRRGARLMLFGGGALFAVLLLAFHYPASMVGVPGTDRTNSHPPSLLVLALASVQCGAAILLRNRLDGLLRRRRSLWAAVVTVNLCAMTIFCWHQTALLTLAIPGSLLGTPIPGLTTPPDSIAWILARLAWLPLVAAVLIALGRLTHRFEAPWTGVRGPRRAAVAVLAGAFACYALTVV